MNRCGGLLKKSILVFFILALAALFRIDRIALADGGYVSGTGSWPNGGKCYGSNVTWDTCYGLSWQYYKWPENYNGDIYFWCTRGTTCQADVYPHIRDDDGDVGGGKIRVPNECSKYGGFWYLGYEVYDAKSNGMPSRGYQVGKPRVDGLNNWMLGIVEPSISGLGWPLYPIGRPNYVNSAFANMDIENITHEDITAAGYVPKVCNNHAYICPTRNAVNATSGGARQVSEDFKGEYYGSLAEVYTLWRRTTDKLSVSDNFGDINWWCGDYGNVNLKRVDGQSNVQIVGKDSDYIASGWVYTDHSGNSESAKAESAITANADEVVTINFKHELTGGLSTFYDISMSGISNGLSDVTNQRYRYANYSGSSSFSTLRSIDVDMSTVSGNSITICDTQTFGPTNARKYSKACAKINKKADTTITTSSTISYGSQSKTDSDSDGKPQILQINTVVPSGTKSINLNFSHKITTVSAGNANNIAWSVTQSGGSGVTVSEVRSKSGTTSLTAPASAPQTPQTVDSSTIKVSNITANTDATICQKLTTTYKGEERNTEVCARIIGSGFTSYSKVSGVTGSKTTSTHNGTADLGTINVTVVPGNSGTTTLTFTHGVQATSGISGSGSQSVPTISYEVTQTPTNNSSVTSFTKVSDSASLTVTPSSPNPSKTASNVNITVSDINKNTDVTVCQTLVAEQSGTTRKTTACARVKGNELAVKGRSSVGSTNGTGDATTGWKVGTGTTAATAPTYEIYMPYKGSNSKNIYFKHELQASSSVTADAGSATYTIKRDGSNLSGYVNKTQSFGTVSGGSTVEKQVYLDSTSVTTGTKVCQTLAFTYGNTSGDPQACAKVTGVQPTVKGESKAKFDGTERAVTASNNSSTALDLGSIDVKVAKGKTGTQKVLFTHTVIAETTRIDAKNQSTGNIPYKITNKDGGSLKDTNYSGTFPNSFENSKLTASGVVRNEYDTVTVAPGETKEVCQTLNVDSNVWITKVCATVKGVLSMPTVKSQSSVSKTKTGTYVSTNETSGSTNSNYTETASLPTPITQPVLPSQDVTGGVNVPVYFKHKIETSLSELGWQTTGDINYQIITTGATDNSIVSGTISHIVASSAKTLTELLPSASDAYTRYANARMNQTTTICQELKFEYNGKYYSTKACADVKGITAEPHGRSTATVKRFTNEVADTGYEDGKISVIDVTIGGGTLKGSDIVFDHNLLVGGELEYNFPFKITNTCTKANGGICDNSYDASGSFHYKGYSDGSKADVWFYREKDDEGNYTNIYKRPVSITDADAAKMLEMGRVCETFEYLFDGVWHHSTACINFVKPSSNCPELGVNAGTTSSASYVKKYLGTSTTSPTPDNTSVIYAKPTDNIEFTHCYYPGAQATRYTNDDESKYNNSSNNGKTVYIPTRNAFVEQQNSFVIGNKTGTDNFVGNGNKYTFTNEDQIMRIDPQTNTFIGVIGNTNKTSIVSSKTKITSDAVGEEIEQSLLDHPGTNAVSGHSQANCGSGCTVYYKNVDDNNWYDIVRRNSDSNISVSSSAKVIVPYNYITTASIDTGNGYVFAGESMSGKKIKVSVNKRQNNTVGDNYATKTDVSRVRLFMFYTANGNQGEGSDIQMAGDNVDACNYYGGTLHYANCMELPTEEGKTASGLVFNRNSAINGTTGSLAEDVDAFRNSYNVPDIPAGSKVCMGVTVYPAESTDTTPNNGNTFISKAYCRIVAKKPSFQIWGGSLYSSNQIAANKATKYTVDGVISYEPIRQNDAPSITFGSWVEQSIIAGGNVKNVASGAALGYGAKDLLVDTSHPGGSTSYNFCDLSRLSFANESCGTGTTGNFGMSGGDGTKAAIKQKFADKAKEKNVDYNNNTSTYVSLNLSNAGSYVEDGTTRYTYATGNLAISASQKLTPGVTHVVYAKGNVIINQDYGDSILYNNGTYQTIDQIPQYIVIADGNIYIDPRVTRVDAILVAGQNINTCAKLSGGSIIEAKKDGDNKITDLYCARQLKINGVVMAETLKLYRIYGASSGLNSIAPAEIIDYTPNVYFWGSNSASSSTLPEIHNTYQRELAPRQ